MYLHDDDVIKWRQLNTVGIIDLLWGESIGHRWIPLTKGQLYGAFMFSILIAWKKIWILSRVISDLTRHDATTILNDLHRMT